MSIGMEGDLENSDGNGDNWEYSDDSKKHPKPPECPLLSKAAPHPLSNYSFTFLENLAIILQDSVSLSPHDLSLTPICLWKWKWSRSVVSDSLQPHGL